MNIPATRPDDQSRELGAIVAAAARDRWRRLAIDLATTERTIFRYEAGESAMSDEFKLTTARYFGVSVAALMGWPEGPPARLVQPLADP